MVTETLKNKCYLKCKQIKKLSHEKFRTDKIQNIKMEQSKQYTTVIHSNIY